jgi:hypothetical protein
MFVMCYRELVVQFNADVADGMPWKFTPCQREVRLSLFMLRLFHPSLFTWQYVVTLDLEVIDQQKLLFLYD